MNEKNKNVSLEKIVGLFDGEEQYINCVLSFEQCDLNNPCPIHEIYSPVKTRFLREMHQKTIGELFFKGNSLK